MDITQDSGVSDYLAGFDKPINVSVTQKLSQWSFQQELLYNAQLPYISQDFMGLQDTYDQLNVYSSSSPILKAAFSSVTPTLKLNLNVNKKLYTDPSLGLIGNLFKNVSNYSKVFATSSDSSLSDITES